MADDDEEELVFDDRRNQRARTLMAGAVVHAGATYPCKIVDLSAGGCRAVCDVEFASGMPVHVDVGAHGRFPAVVIWTEGRTVGLGFAESEGQTLARFGPSAAALGLVATAADDDLGPAKIIDPT